MARPAVKEVTIIGKKVCSSHRSQEKGAHCTTGHTEKPQAQSGGDRPDGKM